MATLLLITVGGSPAPILTAINSLRPDRIIFICSDGPRGSLSQIVGEGTPCEKSAKRSCLYGTFGPATVPGGIGSGPDLGVRAVSLIP